MIDLLFKLTIAAIAYSIFHLGYKDDRKRDPEKFKSIDKWASIAVIAYFIVVISMKVLSYFE